MRWGPLGREALPGGGGGAGGRGPHTPAATLESSFPRARVRVLGPRGAAPSPEPHAHT